MIKPCSEYKIRTKVYEQEVVAKALGIKLKKNEILNIYADGHNKVRVEVYCSPHYKKVKGE